MKKHLVILSILLFLVAVYYLPLTKAYFQQDEWLAFGNYYGLASHSVISLLKNSFAANIGHYIPLYYLSFYGLVSIIQTNFVIWQVLSIIWHLAITVSVYILLKRLFLNNKLALLGTALFGFSGSAHQATSWVIADTNTHGATLLGIISLIFAGMAAGKRNEKKYIVLSIVMFITSLLFKETTIALFVCSPILFLLMKFDSFNKSLKAILVPWSVAGAGYISLRALMFLLPHAKTTASVATQSQTIWEIALNMITFPSKALAQSLIPSKWWLRFSESILGRLHITGGNDVHTTGFVEFVSGFLGAFFVTVFIVAIIFVVFAWLRNANDKNVRLMVFSIVFVSLNSFIIAFSPERTGIITFIDSRNLYFLLVGAIVFLLAFIQYFNLFEVKKKTLYLSFVCIFLLNISAGLFDFRDLITIGRTRAQILTELSKQIPQLSEKQVIFLESDASYYGLPQSEPIPPFQSGFGQTLLIVLSKRGAFPSSFYSQNFLWGITSQGYREQDGRGFGFYRKYNDLLSDLKQYNISPEKVVSFRWRSNTEALTNQTEIVRTKLNNDLRK